jgi:aminoglycoside phosphotransferase (APT) family kinase protein
MAVELSDTNAVEYLASRGLVQASAVQSVELLGWGISNTLVKVCTDDDCLVVKQSLPRLRVTEDWFADRKRIFRERACIGTLAHFLPAGTIPVVRYEDRENFLFAMSCAPAEGANWKEQLLSGQVDPLVAYKVGATLGTIHRMTADNESVRQQFLDDLPFVQLRIDPYHWTTARAHPEVAEVIRQEAQRMLGVKAALVHGDYSPKNIIVTGDDIFLLDFEVVHYGNPVFDLAFMLNHLLLKSVHNAPIRDQYFLAADSFWQGYVSQAKFTPNKAEQIERGTIKQLGCLMLARIDGKSPVEYIVRPEAKNLVRDIAKALLVKEYPKLAGVVELIDDQLGIYDGG